MNSIHVENIKDQKVFQDLVERYYRYKNSLSKSDIQVIDVLEQEQEPEKIVEKASKHPEVQFKKEKVEDFDLGPYGDLEPVKCRSCRCNLAHSGQITAQHASVETNTLENSKVEVLENQLAEIDVKNLRALQSLVDKVATSVDEPDFNKWPTTGVVDNEVKDIIKRLEKNMPVDFKRSFIELYTYYSPFGITDSLIYGIYDQININQKTGKRLKKKLADVNGLFVECLEKNKP